MEEQTGIYWKVYLRFYLSCMHTAVTECFRACLWMWEMLQVQKPCYRKVQTVNVAKITLYDHLNLIPTSGLQMWQLHGDTRVWNTIVDQDDESIQGRILQNIIIVWKQAHISSSVGRCNQWSLHLTISGCFSHRKLHSICKHQRFSLPKCLYYGKTYCLPSDDEFLQ